MSEYFINGPVFEMLLNEDISGLEQCIVKLTAENSELKAKLSDAITTNLNNVGSSSKEIAELKAKVNDNSHTCTFCNWTNVGCLNIADVGKEPQWICHGCVKRLHESREQTEARCAEMRKSISEALPYLPHIGVGGYYHQGRCALESAISTDCGKGWINPEKGKALREALLCARGMLDNARIGPLPGEQALAATADTAESKEKE